MTPVSAERFRALWRADGAWEWLARVGPGALWNSIDDEAKAGAEIPLSTETRELLDARVREDDEDPDAAIPWANARARLHRDR